jgi:hypothetical protein
MGTERTIVYVHFQSRPVGCFADPHVEILGFTGLEEEHVVTVVKVG